MVRLICARASRSLASRAYSTYLVRVRVRVGVGVRIRIRVRVRVRARVRVWVRVSPNHKALPLTLALTP